MIKVKIMTFREREHFVEILADWRDAQMQQIGLQYKDKELLKGYYWDCISTLDGLGMIDIEKVREFVKNVSKELN